MQKTTDTQDGKCNHESHGEGGLKLETTKPETLPKAKSLHFGQRMWKKSKSQKNRRRHATKDDTASTIKEEGFLLKSLFRAMIPKVMFVCTNVAVLTAWSCICAWGADKAKVEADNEPNGTADRWLGYLENTSGALKTIGVLFTFSVIFRFNVCYHRWWEGRVYWGSIISATIDLAQMNRKWVADRAVADRISRFIIVYAYACKSQLRGKSLCESGESGPVLVRKGILTEEELRDIDKHPCWQPYYAIDMIRHAFVHAYNKKGDALCLGYDHKAYTQLFRSFDNALVRLSNLIGDTIRVRASGLPKSYDVAHFAIFYTFFLAAPIAWSVSMGWAAPLFVGLISTISLLLMLMGTTMVDPFGTDVVDLPLDRFCETIEIQILEIDARAERGDLRSFAKSAEAKPTSAQNPFRESCSFRIGDLR